MYTQNKQLSKPTCLTSTSYSSDAATKSTNSYTSFKTEVNLIIVYLSQTQNYIYNVCVQSTKGKQVKHTALVLCDIHWFKTVFFGYKHHTNTHQLGAAWVSCHTGHQGHHWFQWHNSPSERKLLCLTPAVLSLNIRLNSQGANPT